MATLAPSGLLVVDRAIERYPVRPGGVTVVALGGDDQLRIIDRYGGQVAELTTVGAGFGPTHPTPDADATVLRARGVPVAGLDPSEARCVRLFGPDSAPGAQLAFTAVGDTTVAVGAPGGRVIDGDAPATELALEVRRAAPRPEVELELPAPLAEPRLDFRIDPASAQSYEVREGEYIQIIDVRGKQCSDFLAFHAAKLHSGLERGLDSTVTRTLMGSAYPQPGLYRKFYDLDMDPLVEVVRDTVGRHDTFALACQAKYYEDMGYPGHVNCTDNFNGALRAFEVAPRKGWEALNFFYNTTFDSNMQLAFDEPWSRPGDYVMLRAASDLVCASSACPDDIDPSNAWEVTDVHVRVYSPENRFSMAVARRVTADAEAVLTRETALSLEDLGADPELRGVPRLLAAPLLQQRGRHRRVLGLPRAAGGHGPLPLRKWEVLGPDAETLMQTIVTRNIRKLAVGQVVYTALCNETGGMIDDATVFRLGQDNFRFIGGDEYDGIWMRQVADRLGLKVWIKPTTDQLHNIAVQGPFSREALAEFVWAPPVTAVAAGAQVVPLPGRAHRVLRRRADRSSRAPATPASSATRFLPPVRRRGGVGRGLEGRRAARDQAPGARGARHAAHRVRAHLRRL